MPKTHDWAVFAALVWGSAALYIRPNTVQCTMKSNLGGPISGAPDEMKRRTKIMTTTIYSRDISRTDGFTMGAGLLGRVRTYLAKSRAERQLSQLDDRLLADIGVKRSDINKMVWGR